MKEKANNLLVKFCKKYDKTLGRENRQKIKQAFIALAILAFFGNLFVIFINNIWEDSPIFISKFGDNYFSTIFTPFSIILFYEIFQLVLAIPSSMTKSLAKQFEIITLIIILRVFKDVSEVSTLENVGSNTEIIQKITLDMGASLILFSLITLFYLSLRRRIPNQTPTEDRALIFIRAKKVITVVLSFIVAILFLTFTASWLIDGIESTATSFYEYQQVFFETLFTILIFVDVLIVLLSYYFSDEFELIFRNAAFIISIILIRFSVTSDRPNDLPLAILALAFGLLINVLYNEIKRFKGDFRNNSVQA